MLLKEYSSQGTQKVLRLLYLKEHQWLALFVVSCKQKSSNCQSKGKYRREAVLDYVNLGNKKCIETWDVTEIRKLLLTGACRYICCIQSQLSKGQPANGLLSVKLLSGNFHYTNILLDNCKKVQVVQDTTMQQAWFAITPERLLYIPRGSNGSSFNTKVERNARRFLGMTLHTTIPWFHSSHGEMNVLTDIFTVNFSWL